MKKTYLFIFGILIITAAIIFIGWEDIYQIMSRMNVYQLILMILLQLATLLLSAFILFYLIKQKSKRISIFNVFCINQAGSFVESITPSVKIGGETLKMYLLHKKTYLPYSEIAALTVVNKFYSLLPFLIIAFLTLCAAAIAFNLPIFVYLAFIGLLSFFSLFLIFFNYQRLQVEHFFEKIGVSSKKRRSLILEKTGEKARKLHNFLAAASQNSRKIITTFQQKALVFTTSFVIWAFYPIKVYLISSMLGYQLSPVIVITAIYTAYLVSMIPLFPGGLATFEGSLALVLTSEGLSYPEAFSIALMVRLITFWIPLAISAAFTIYLIPKKTRKEGVLN